MPEPTEYINITSLTNEADSLEGLFFAGESTDPQEPTEKANIGKLVQELTTKSESQIVGGGIFPKQNNVITQGDAIPTGTSYLRMGLQGDNALFSSYAPISGTVSSILDDTDFKKSVVADSVTYNLYYREAFEGKVNVRCFGAVGNADRDTRIGHDDTQAFKSAIAFARYFNGLIYAPKTEATKCYLLDDSLFFGPLNEDSISTFPPKNICLGIVGDGDESTNIVCGDGLADKVVFDYTGLGHKYAQDFTLWSLNEAKAPLVGILTARFKNPKGGVTGNYGGHFKDVTMFKYFKIACRLAITTEETREERVNIRNDHTDSYGCFVSTADGSSESYPADEGGSYPAGPSWNDLIGEVSESTLAREDIAGSNLHQTHVKCDYYYGNNNPDPKKKPCMLRIDGANGMSVRDPFFNNNLTSVDCVQVRKAGAVGIPFGISIINPLYHQNVKSGVRVMTGLNRLDIEQSIKLPGFQFEEAEIVVDGYLSGATIESVDSIIINETLENSTISYVTGAVEQNNTITNCEIEAVNHFSQKNASKISNSNITCKTMDWNTDSSIQNSELAVRDTLNAIGNRGGDPKFSLRYNGSNYDVEGQIPASWLGSPSGISGEALNYKTSNLRTLDYYFNRSANKASQVIEHENSGFSGSMVEMKAPSGSTGDFNYRALTRGGTPEITEKKGGLTIYELSAGGAVFTSPNGKKWRLIISNEGVPSAVAYGQTDAEEGLTGE